MSDGSTCSMCSEPAWGATKDSKEPKCYDHFACICGKCGHEAFWLTTKRRPEGRWVCFSLSCDWQSDKYTRPFNQS